LSTERVYFFANTLWFLVNFKGTLIEETSKKSIVRCLYLREGPDINNEKFVSLVSRGIVFERLSYLSALHYSLVSFISLFRRSGSCKKNTILTYTIGPILLSSFLFYGQQLKKIVVLEGMGRLFSSKRILSRLTKRIISLYYRVYFKGMDKIVVLNASDASYLASRAIADYSRIYLAPGTGVDTRMLRYYTDSISFNPSYIDYIGRFVAEKGVYSFIYAKNVFDSIQTGGSKKYRFRLVLPEKDIANMKQNMLEDLKKSGIDVHKYSSEPFDYYRESAVVVHPSEYAEGLSRVVMEVAYIGLPLVTLRNKGIEELLTNDYRYFLPNTSPHTIAHLIVKALGDRDYFESVKQIHRDKIDRLYSQTAADCFFLDLIYN